jgi:hypothetical protein
VFEEVEFFQCFFEFGHFFVDFVVQGFFLCHGFSAFGVIVQWRAFVIVCWLPNGQSVIEEKGEGFENGKNSISLLGVAFNLNYPPHCVIRLTTLYTYKGYELALSKKR